MTTPKPEDVVKVIAAAIRAVMPEMFGTPEALADPARIERFNKSSDQMAEKYARAAIAAMPAPDCIVCDGTGTDLEHDETDCDICGGTGKAPTTPPEGYAANRGEKA